MMISTGHFLNPEDHHEGWFRVFRFGKSIFEVWFGGRYYVVHL